MAYLSEFHENPSIGSEVITAEHKDTHIKNKKRATCYELNGHGSIPYMVIENFSSAIRSEQHCVPRLYPQIFFSGVKLATTRGEELLSLE